MTNLARGAVPLIEARAAVRAPYWRYFFVWQAVFFILVAIVGFSPGLSDFFAGTFPLPWTAHAHGVVMMSWLLLYLFQTSLAARGELRLHRRLGLASLWLAILVLLTMVVASVTSLERYDPSLTKMVFLYDVLAVQLVMICWFVVFVSWAALARNHAPWHRRMMTFATLVLLQAAVDRMHWLPNEGLPMFWHHAIRLYVLMLPMLVFDLVTLRRLHPATLVCITLILIGHGFISAVWEDADWRMLVHGITTAWR